MMTAPRLAGRPAPTPSLQAVFRIALAAGALAAPPAYAQGTGLATLPPLLAEQDVPDEERLGVLDRARPEYTPAGLTLGSFTVRPSVEIGVGYANNIFAGSQNQVGDGYYAIIPLLDVRSNWSRNALRMSATGQIYNYFSTKNATENEYQVSADTRIDVVGLSAIDFGGSISREIERRDSGSFPTGRVGPLGFDRRTAYLRGAYVAGNWRFIAQSDFSNFEFSDARALDLNNDLVSLIDQGDRDRSIVRIGGRAEYAPTGTYSIFVTGNYGHYAYDRKTLLGTTSPNRDGQQVEVTAGLALQRSLLRGTVSVGYVRRSYDSPLYNNIDGLSLHGDLTYLATPVLTLTASADRQIQDTSIINAGGYILTRGSLRADYEARRNLIFSLRGVYRINDFQGLDRTDHIGEGHFQVRYLINRSVEMRGTADIIRRTSNFGASVPSYTDVRGGLSVILRY